MFLRFLFSTRSEYDIEVGLIAESANHLDRLLENPETISSVSALNFINQSLGPFKAKNLNEALKNHQIGYAILPSNLTITRKSIVIQARRLATDDWVGIYAKDGFILDGINTVLGATASEAEHERIKNDILALIEGLKSEIEP